MNILLVEDDVSVAEFVQRGLTAERHQVTLAQDGGQGFEFAQSKAFSVIVLDLTLPTKSGYEVCRDLRSEGIKTPILILTVIDELENKIKCMRSGADDYLTKPFAFEELLVRIEALNRRSKNMDTISTLLKVADLEFDKERVRVHRGSAEILLTAKELSVLELLMSSPGKVFSRTSILNNVWGYDADRFTNVVDVCIAKLRKKIDLEGEQQLIETVRGRGYRINDV